MPKAKNSVLEKVAVVLASLSAFAIIGVCLFFVASVDTSPRGCCCNVFPQLSCRNPNLTSPWYSPENCGFNSSGEPTLGVCVQCDPGIPEARCEDYVVCDNTTLYYGSTCSWFRVKGDDTCENQIKGKGYQILTDEQLSEMGAKNCAANLPPSDRD